MTPATAHDYLLCITDRGNPLSVMKGKLYRVVEPHPNDTAEFVRIIDEENEDYPYPRDWFAPLDLPESILKALNAA